MKYIDSSGAEVDQTVASWMREVVAQGPCEFRCQTGYFTGQGSNALLPQLSEWSELDLPQKLVIGSNQAVTLASHVAYLAGALGLHRPNVKLGIVCFDSGLFHPKVYHFRRSDGTETAYVGSANLTGPGLNGLNVEAGLIVDSRDDDPRVLTEIRERIDAWFEGGLEGILPIGSADDIQRLLDAGYLSVIVARPPPEAGQGDESDPREPGPPRTSRRSLVSLARLRDRERLREDSEPDRQDVRNGRTYRYTEASFHYPQGTHLGHILSILWRFASGRQGTSFDDDFIRLRGSLGHGRIAGFRRQIKYKLLAAMELRLLTDIRLSDDPADFSPEITEVGFALWELLAPFVDTNQLVMSAEEMSAKTPEEASFYTTLVGRAAEASPELRALYSRTAEAMPAVVQMQQFIASFEARTISKNALYEGFFEFEPVVEFCNEVGIDPQTEESARHRCPFLLNILESLGQIEQGPRDILRR